MKLTKSQLKKIIKEELEVILTNEEAGEMFGEEVQRQLEEDMIDDADKEESAEADEEEGEAETAAALAGGDKADYAASAATPTQESADREGDAAEAKMIQRLEGAIKNAKELVRDFPDNKEAAKVLNYLETRYHHIMNPRKARV